MKFSHNSCLENFDSICLSESQHDCRVLFEALPKPDWRFDMYYLMLRLPTADVDFLKAILQIVAFDYSELFIYLLLLLFILQGFLWSCIDPHSESGNVGGDFEMTQKNVCNVSNVVNNYI